MGGYSKVLSTYLIFVKKRATQNLVRIAGGSQVTILDGLGLSVGKTKYLYYYLLLLGLSGF